MDHGARPTAAVEALHPVVLHRRASQQADGAEGGHGSILIAGTTSLNQSALTAVMSEWTSTRPYADKIANISGTGSGPNGNGTNYLQAGTTVFDDANADQLYSDTKGQLNWLLYTFSQDIANRVKTGETTTDTA